MNRCWAAAVALAAVATLGGCASAGAGTATVPSTTAVAPTTTATPRPTTTPAALPGPAPLPRTAAISVTSVTIKAIGVRTSGLEKLSLLADGTLAAPKNPDRAGWFGAGTLPGNTGPAVIAGHVDSTTGPAVFYELRLLKPGDTVVVGLSTGRSVDFTVDDVITTAKNGFPTDRVYGPTPDRQLRLITCGGPYDRSAGGYQDNTVVFATAV